MILSVIVPTMNKVDLLSRTLAALRRQTLAGDEPWEIVVVNDGSSDGTAELLATLEAEPGTTLRSVSPPRNVGRARARNLGAEAAVGRWLLFLDDDIIAPDGLLQAHLDILAASPDHGTIGYAVTDPQVVDAPHFHYLDTRGVARLQPGPAPARFFVTQNAAVPREAFLAVGGFDEDFSGYGFEDMEIAFRLEDTAKIRFQALTTPVPVHVHHHTFMQYLEKKVDCGRLSLRQIARLHPDRLREMSLNRIVTGDGRRRNTFVSWLASGPLAAGLINRLASWPCGPGYRPRCPSLYYRLMNLAVLRCFCQGLKQTN